MMKKEIIILIIGMILVSGCTTTTTEPVISGGRLTLFSYYEESTVNPDSATTLNIQLKNMFSNDLENIEIKLSPVFNGISYEVYGAESVEANSTEDWTIEIDVGSVPLRNYDLYPLICFDYSQEDINYFRVSDKEPTVSTIDSSLSDNGPVEVIIEGLKAINTDEETKLDVSVSYSIKQDSIIGGVPEYEIEDDLILTYAVFYLDSVNKLILYTTENNINSIEKYCDIQESGSYQGKSTCYSDINYDFNAGFKFDFDIKTQEGILGSNDFDNLFRAQLELIDEEIETSFNVETKYRFCIRGTGLQSLVVSE